MDKKSLNNEIVLCRAAVRKAKVAVIRKIIKKMKILKGCKIEAVKEKKLRKSERLFQKVQIMKKVKVDEVTKFALRNKDLEPFLKGPKVDLRQNALALLAQHDAVVKKINSIREQIPNWETEISLLLDVLGKKNKKNLNRKKESVKSMNRSDKSDEKVVKKDEIKDKVKYTVIPMKEGIGKSSKRQLKVDDDDDDESVKSEVSDRGVGKTDSNSSEVVNEIEKVVDPFFIGKKVIAPKLSLKSEPCETDEGKIRKPRKSSLKRENNSSLFHTKPYKSKKELNEFMPQLPKKMVQEEKIHPSWAAKKVKLIKPFQGKKIKFTDD